MMFRTQLLTKTLPQEAVNRFKGYLELVESQALTQFRKPLKRQ